MILDSEIQVFILKISLLLRAFEKCVHLRQLIYIRTTVFVISVGMVDHHGVPVIACAGDWVGAVDDMIDVASEVTIPILA